MWHWDRKSQYKKIYFWAVSCFKLLILNDVIFNKKILKCQYQNFVNFGSVHLILSFRGGKRDLSDSVSMLLSHGSKRDTDVLVFQDTYKVLTSYTECDFFSFHFYYFSLFQLSAFPASCGLYDSINVTCGRKISVVWAVKNAGKVSEWSCVWWCTLAWTQYGNWAKESSLRYLGEKVLGKLTDKEAMVPYPFTLLIFLIILLFFLVGIYYHADHLYKVGTSLKSEKEKINSSGPLAGTGRFYFMWAHLVLGVFTVMPTPGPAECF